MRRVVLGLTLLLAGCGAAAPAQSPRSGSSAPRAASASAQASAAASPGVAKLEVGFSQFIPHYLPLWVAQDAGIYAKHGLVVDQKMVASTTGLDALLAGELQVNVGGGPELVSAAAGGADVVGVANLTPVSSFKFEVAKSIQTKQDLIGKKIGISRFGANTDTSVRALLIREGLNPDKDVAYVQMNTAANTTAGLLSGSIQAALSNPPQTLTLEANGLHPMYDLAQMKVPGIDTVVEVKRSWLNAHRDIMQRYVDSLIEALSTMRQNKTLTEATLAKNLKLNDQAAVDSVYAYFVGSVFPTLPYLRAEQFSDAMPVLVKQSEQLRGYDVSKVIDASLVQNGASRDTGASSPSA